MINQYILTLKLASNINNKLCNNNKLRNKLHNKKLTYVLLKGIINVY